MNGLYIITEIQNVLKHDFTEVDNLDHYRSCILREKADFEEAGLPAVRINK